VTLVQFGPSARFEHGDVLLITRALGRLLEASRNWPSEAIEPVVAAGAWLGGSIGCARHDLASHWRASGSISPQVTRCSELGRKARVDLEKERVLDVAADLLHVSRLLHDAGLLVEAFALEGIEGRLLESLLGAGPVDGVMT